MTTLGSKARRLQITVLQQLEQHRTELLYQLTAFDLQKSYWETTLNKSIENLKFARNFFHQHSQRIFEQKSQQFREKYVSIVPMCGGWNSVDDIILQNYDHVDGGGG